jgi:hypothetical protein
VKSGTTIQPARTSTSALSTQQLSRDHIPTDHLRLANASSWRTGIAIASAAGLGLEMARTREEVRYRAVKKRVENCIVCLCFGADMERVGYWKSKFTG